MLRACSFVFCNNRLQLVNLSWNRISNTRESSKMIGSMYLAILWSSWVSLCLYMSLSCFLHCFPSRCTPFGQSGIFWLQAFYRSLAAGRPASGPTVVTHWTKFAWIAVLSGYYLYSWIMHSISFNNIQYTFGPGWCITWCNLFDERLSL